MNDQQEQNEPPGESTRDLALTMAALKVIREQGAGVVKDGDKFDAGVAKLPGKGEWVKAAPAVAMACGTMLIVTVVIVFGVLAVTGTPTDPFFRLINLFVNILGTVSTLAVLGVALMHARRTLVNRAVSARAADEAHEAAEQSAKTAIEVNGKLTARLVATLGPIIAGAVDEAVDRALSQRCPDPEEGDEPGDQYGGAG